MLSLLFTEVSCCPQFFAEELDPTQFSSSSINRSVDFAVVPVLFIQPVLGQAVSQQRYSGSETPSAPLFPSVPSARDVGALVEL